MIRKSLTALFLLAALPQASKACSACGCTLDTDDALGANAEGLRADIRYDYLNQIHLLLGGKDPKAADLDASQREVQHQTRTHSVTTSLDYNFAEPWGLNIAIPVLSRFHSSYSDPDNPQVISAVDWTQLGDIRVVGRYSGLFESRETALLAGLKLPTGATNSNFTSGTSAGQPLDRGLQPGSGTTDLLLGLAQNGRLGENFGWYATLIWQKPLDVADQFRPAQTLNVNAGLRYDINPSILAQFQINAQNRWRDTGLQSDRPNSGGEVIFASPGATLLISESTSLYGFVQIPIYQRVGGLELVTYSSVSVGFSHKF